MAQCDILLCSAETLACIDLTYSQVLPASDPVADLVRISAIIQLSAKGYRAVSSSFDFKLCV